MASGLQYRNSGSVGHGYAGGVSSGSVPNWSDTGLSGSHEQVVWWADNGGNSSCESYVYMTVRDSWTGTRNSDNSITLNVTTTWSMNRVPQRTGGCTGCSGFLLRDVKVYTDSSKSSQIGGATSCVSDSGVFCTGSRSWSITLAHGQSKDVGGIFVWNPTRGYETQYYDDISAGMAFRNTLPQAPYNPSASLSCDKVANSSKGTASLNVSDWGCPGGGSPANNCSLSSSVEWFTDSSYTNRVATGTGEKTLAPNTKYYLKATVSNGYYNTTKTCSFTTLATSSVYNYKFLTDQVSKITVQANYGGEACDITTILQLREKGTSSWQTITLTTPGLHGTEVETLRNIIVRGKTYEARTQTTNCAGTYTSPIYEFAPPAADSISGVVTSHNDELESSGLTTTLDWCYKVTAYTLTPPSESNPITSHFEYRLDGQDEWVTLDSHTSTSSPDTICGSESGLACGSKYYLRSYQKIGSIESYSPVVEHTTAQCADVNNCVCDNLHYMTELICQTLNRIEEGEKTIYANCQVKELCDPYSQNPTLAGILSRIVRFSQMAACLICSMEELDFAGGQDNEIYTATEPGEYGQFVPLSQEMTEDSDEIISSYAVKQAVDALLQSILRPIGTYNYYAEDMTDLDAQTTEYSPISGDTAVIGDKYYTYDGSDWSETAEVVDLQDFGLVNILDGKWALHEYYWWDDEWNILDATKEAVAARIQVLEDVQDEVVYDEDDEHHNMMTAPLSYTDAQISAIANAKYPNEDVAVFLYESGSISTCWILDTDLLDGSVGLC